MHSNIYPNSLLSWNSTQDLNYVKFMTNKNMCITRAGVDRMLKEMVEEFGAQQAPQPVQQKGREAARGNPGSRKLILV